MHFHTCNVPIPIDKFCPNIWAQPDKVHEILLADRSMPACSPTGKSHQDVAILRDKEGSTPRKATASFRTRRREEIMVALTINGQSHDVDVEPDTPLLWVIREKVGLTGTKYGCGIAQCGACTVHVDGVAMRSCSVPVGDASPARRSPPSKASRRTASCTGAAGLARARRAAMRLLPERHDHGGGGAAEGEAEADRRRHRRGDHQYLPLRHLPAGARGDPRRGQAREGRRP